MAKRREPTAASNGASSFGDLRFKERKHGGEYEVPLIRHPASNSQMVFPWRDNDLHAISQLPGFTTKRPGIGLEHREVLLSHDQKRRWHALRYVSNWARFKKAGLPGHVTD